MPPILLDLSDDGFQLIDLSESAAFFDYDADSYLENIGWVSGDDGILSIDLNGSGTIDGASEFVFANETEAEDTDLEALAELYDSNVDGVLNAEDEAWEDFRVWQDWNGDGQSQEGEVSTLEELNITEVGLVSNGVEEEIAGNTIHGRATFTREDGTTGDVGDVSFRASSYGYRETEDGIEIGDGNALIVGGDEDQVRDLADSNYDGLVTGAGDDTLGNSSGDDGYLSAGAGNDTLIGGSGNDWLSGGDGADTIVAGTGHDILFVDAQDVIDGGAGFDVVLGQGEDSLSIDLGVTNTEAVYGAAGNDDLRAGRAINVTIDGGAGDDQVIGGEGHDLLSGGEGADTLRSGEGDDTLIVDENDDFNGGAGQDRVIFMGDADLDINITDYEVEVFNSGGGDDIIRTDQAYEAAIDGGEGNDTIFGGWGADWLNGGHGTDTLQGGYGDDTYMFGRGSGSDTIRDYSHNIRTDTIYDLYSDGSRRNVRTRMVEVHENAGNDRIVFGPDINPNDLLIRADGQDLIIALKNPEYPDASFDDLSDQLRLVNWQDVRDRVEGLEFSSGTVIDIGAMLTNLGFAADGVVLDVGTAMSEKLGDFAAGIGDEGIGLAGTINAELLLGGDGNDVIAGGGGNDIIGGGDGDDRLYGQDGNDIISGGEGADLLDGGAGDDTLLSDGNDTLIGGSGNDTVHFINEDGVQLDLSDAGIENILGSLGDDELSALGLEESIYMHGGAGNDTLSTGAGADSLLGGSGDDILDGGFGDDILDGGADDDRFVGNEGADTMLGGDGQDIVDYSGSDQGVDLSLENGGTAGAAAGDSFDGVENVIGTDHDDVISGNATDNTLDAGVGDDSLSGEAGDDLLVGGSGDDVLDGGDGSDTLEGGVGDDTLSGGTGQDTINAGAGDDRIVARGDGDIIDGGDGSDTLDYSDADEGVRLDMSDTTGYQAGSVEDRAENVEQVAGSSADDDLAAGSGNDQMAGGLGDDVLTGRLGDDILDGGSGDDTILGQQGDDTLSGGDGNDIISGGSGDDILFGGSGDDLIFGGEGDDTVVFAGSRDDYLLTRDGDDLVVTGENGTTRIEDVETIRFDDGDFAVEDLLDDDDLPSVTDTTRQRRDEMSQTSFAASVAAAAALGGLASSYDNTAQAAEVIQEAADQASAEGDNIWLVAPLADNGGTDGSDNIAGASGDDMLAANGDVTADVANAFAKSDQLGVILSELGAAAQNGGDAPIARVLSEEEMQAALAADALDDESANGGVSDGVSGSDESDDTASSDTVDGQDDASESGENSGADDNGVAFFNAPPTAVDDYVFSLEDQEIRVALSDLLGNDHDRENNVLRLDGIISASHGTVSVRDGYMTFVPDADYNGRAEVRYWIHDGYGNRVESVLNIDLSPVNDTPEISVQSTRTHYGTAVDLTSLVTASDRDGDAVYVDLRDAAGLGHFEVDGVAVGDDTTVRVLASELDRVRYIPSHNLNTAETLIARTFDGELYSAWETFEITADNTRLGSEGDDILQAGGLGDILDGFAGNDTLTGGAANDLLLGRAGEDTLDGGDGDDTLYGGEGNDTLIGGSGDNTLFGGDGDDTLEIVNVDDLDRMFAGSGRDQLIIHNVDDLTLDLSSYDLEEIIAGSGDDYLYSSDNSDLYIDAGAGDDVLQGGDGNDTLIGGDGKDRIEGGAGDDVIEVGLGDNLADIDGGSGNDTLTVSDGVDMTIDMTGINIENVVGGAGAETVTDLFATGSHVSLGAGDDSVVSGAGADVLEGGEGSDTLDYSQSTSSVNVDLASSLVSGGHADGDTISGFENVNDTTFDDVIVGNAKNNRLYSSSGNDALTGGAGADTFAVNIAAGATGTVRIRDFTPSKGDMFSLAGVGGATLIAAATNALANQTMDEDGNVSVIFDNGREVIFEGLGKPLSADMMDAPVVVASETISDEQTGQMTVAVELSKPVDEDVVFDFSLTDGSGSVASDLLASTGAITVSAGDTNGSTKIGANADTAIEGTETFNVKIDQVASGGEAAVALEDVTGTAYLIDQHNTDNQIEQSLYGLDETQLKENYAEGDDVSFGVITSGYVDTNHPRDLKRVVATVSGQIEAGGASYVDFDYNLSIHNSYQWGGGNFRVYYRVDAGDGWDSWTYNGIAAQWTGQWPRINKPVGNYSINFAQDLPEGAIVEVRVDWWHHQVSGRNGGYRLGGGTMDIGTMHTEVLVSNDVFNVGDLNGDGQTDVAYFDQNSGQYVFRYAEIGATTSEAFNLENDTGDAVVGVIGGAGSNAENVSFVAAGAKLYTLSIPADGETVNLSDQPNLTTSAQIKSISLSKIDDATGKILLIGLGDENGLSSILRVAPSNTLLQADIDNAPRIELAAGYTDIVDLGDIDGDGLADIGLQSENGVVRLPRSVFENDNALVQIGSSGEELFVSSADDEVFVGMAGDDTYSFSGSLGHDIIDNTSSSAFEDDSILFNANISPEQLWFSKSGDDLLIEVLGGDQSINVVDWYGEDTSAKLDHISFADGRDLVSHEVEQLVSIMAGVSRTGDEELVTDALSQAQVEEEVEQLWSA
ncbi:cadherin-like domain-containing protein [Thalassospira sp. GB04J01]|uniref:cadherin-like domain-containing protein n=1 Tax=Thalassospira sp. GB04J01 TaxID=1485225 RepID=UPI001304D13D|nr:cadherin-like domain-containing protein [Thalassospira sp. GB04J01]